MAPRRSDMSELSQKLIDEAEKILQKSTNDLKNIVIKNRKTGRPKPTGDEKGD